MILHNSRNPLLSDANNPAAARLDLRLADGERSRLTMKHMRGVLVRGGAQAVGQPWGARWRRDGMACMFPSPERESHCQ